MPSFYTRKGDDGYTGLLGNQRVPKSDLRLEILGTLDEATAALGMARAQCQAPESGDLLIAIQRNLYALMAEVAATPENAVKFRQIGERQVKWLEDQITWIADRVDDIPSEFILPGDTYPGAVIDLSRTIVRRAERRLAELYRESLPSNPDLLRYLNRLSSFLYVLELFENQAAGRQHPTLAKSE